MAVIDRTPVIRFEQPTEWDLSELVPDPSEAGLTAFLADIGASVEAFERRREQLSAGISPNRLLEILAEYQSIFERSLRLSAYGSLWFSADTQSQAALAFRTRVNQELTDLHNRLLFFTLWWRGLDEDEARRLLPARETHPDARHYFEELRRFSPYTLAEESEKLINVKDSNGVEGLKTIYSMLTNRLEFHLETEAGRETLTRDELMRRAYSTDPQLREAAYRELFRVYGAESGILAQIYAFRVRDWYAENVEIRGMASPIAVRNLDNDVPGEAVEALLSVCRERRSVFQRYFRLKAGWLGMERLRRYDLYAPIGESEREIPYAEAVEDVLDTFGAFHPRLGQAARRVFTEGHIDSSVRKGKRGGALCSTVLPELTPWVLVNYTGRLRDVATLAHELGHAVHSMLASDHSVLTQQPSLPLAETASVFGEILITDRLLERERDPLARREILVKTVDDIYATILRQAYFVMFERSAHDAIRAGKSAEELAELYLANLAEQFGDSVIVPDEFRHEWVSIPHIYQNPFYCYAYSFGQLLVLSLYRRYQEEGEAFKPAYLRLLAHGGSAHPQDILAEAGFDLCDRAFWEGGMAVVERMIDELEALKV